MNKKSFNILLNIAVSIFTTVLTVFMIYHFSLVRYFMPSEVSGQNPAVNPLIPRPMAVNSQGVLPSQPLPSAQVSKDICESDLQRYCPSAQDLVQKEICLDQNFEKLSKECRPRMERMRAHYKVCESDISRHCLNASYAGGMMMKCLHENGKILSKSCKSFVGIP